MVEKLENLLLEHNFIKGEVSNSFNKNGYVATIWRSGMVTITKYSPIYNRHLGNATYENYEELKIELELNHKY